MVYSFWRLYWGSWFTSFNIWSTDNYTRCQSVHWGILRNVCYYCHGFWDNCFGAWSEVRVAAGRGFAQYTEPPELFFARIKDVSLFIRLNSIQQSYRPSAEVASIISLVVSWGFLAIIVNFITPSLFILIRQINDDDDDDDDDEYSENFLGNYFSFQF